MNVVRTFAERKDTSTVSRVSPRGVPASSVCACLMGLGHLPTIRETLVLSCAVSAKISSVISLLDMKGSTRVEMNRSVARRYGGGIRSKLARRVGIYQPYKMVCHGAHRRSDPLRPGHHCLLSRIKV